MRGHMISHNNMYIYIYIYLVHTGGTVVVVEFQFFLPSDRNQLISFVFPSIGNAVATYMSYK